MEHPLTATSSCLILGPAGPRGWTTAGWSLWGLDSHLPQVGCIPLTPRRHRGCPSTPASRADSRASSDLSIQRSVEVWTSLLSFWNFFFNHYRHLGLQLQPNLCGSLTVVYFPRGFRGNNTTLEGSLGIPTSLCSTPVVRSRDARRHPLTRPVGCLTWGRTHLEPTTQHSSLLVPASPILHSFIRWSDSLWLTSMGFCLKLNKFENLPTSKSQSLQFKIQISCLWYFKWYYIQNLTWINVWESLRNPVWISSQRSCWTSLCQDRWGIIWTLCFLPVASSQSLSMARAVYHLEQQGATTPLHRLQSMG